MPNIFSWQEAIYDPRFRAVRYHCDGTYRQFPGVTGKERRSYLDEYDFLQQAPLEHDLLAEDKGDGHNSRSAEGGVGYRRLALPFPEGYTWLMDFAPEDGEGTPGIYHAIFHPDMDQAGVLRTTSTGIPLAKESWHQRLPGLRWVELRQIQSCLARNWHGEFAVQAVVPLLYPVVDWITFDELEEVRHTLASAWQELRVLKVKQVDRWLQQIITIYDRGQLLRLNDREKWEPLPWNLGYEGDLWVQAEKDGWQTLRHWSERSIENNSRQFLPFFSMLARYS